MVTAFLNFTGGVPVVPGYGGGYPQQYYQGMSTHVCAQSKSFKPLLAVSFGYSRLKTTLSLCGVNSIQ